MLPWERLTPLRQLERGLPGPPLLLLPGGQGSLLLRTGGEPDFDLSALSSDEEEEEE